ncbi:HIT family protein [Blattabacterium cuenoti]|uniref:HIT family protein n=1 Tax=Blattabacterium cuenoti TaxID=1653831 RepID=UPI00163C6EC4|nr:HIT family protein [Blattabacterium cuenoti]
MNKKDHNIFKDIIENKTFAYKIAEDFHHLAFLDIYPMKIGHTLVIPKKSINNIFSMTEKRFLSIMSFCRKVGIALEKTVPCNRIGIFVLGFEVPHVHIHLIPMDTENDGNFSKKRIFLSKKNFVILSKKIKEHIID